MDDHFHSTETISRIEKDFDNLKGFKMAKKVFY